jgi:creatinine amidohydrolase
VPGHAGRFETSLVLALRPDLVGVAPLREPQEVRHESSFWHEDDRAWSSIDGYTDNPAEATAEEGERYLAALVAGVADALREFDRATRDTLEGGER